MNSSPSYRVAVAGAASLIGEALIDRLKEQRFPMSALHRVDELRELGHLGTGGPDVPESSIASVADFDFARCDVAFFCGRAPIALQYAEVAAQQAWVIDSSGAFRSRDDVPMHVADVNPPQLTRDGPDHGLIATPGSASVALATALAPLHRLARLERIDVATYHAASGGGRGALEALARDTANLMNGRHSAPRGRVVQSAFNAVPQVGDIDEEGISREERRIAEEVARVLGTDVPVNVTAVRVPVFYGHSFAVHAVFTDDIEPAAALEALAGAPGIDVQADSTAIYSTAAGTAGSPDKVYVGRVRADRTRPRSLNLWVVADNVRKCAAFNAAALAQILVNRQG